MIVFFLKIFDYLSGKKLLVVLLLLATIAASVFVALRATYKEDIAAFLPSDSLSQKYVSVYNSMAGQERVAVLFRIDEAGEQDRSEDIQIAMTDFAELLSELDTLGAIRNLQVQVDEVQMLDFMEFIYKNYPYMLSEKDWKVIEDVIGDSAFLQRQMENNRRLLMLPTATTVVHRLPYDPINLSVSLIADLQAMKVGDAFQIINGFTFTQDGRCGLIFFDSPYGVSESGENAGISELIEETKRTYLERHSAAQVHISAIGAPLIAAANAQQIKQDSVLAVSLAVILILLVLVYSFRRLGDIFYVGLSVGVGWLFAIGCMSLLKEGMSIIVLGVGSVIIGIAVNYPLHYLCHMRHQTDRRAALKELVAPLLIGNITTVSAFACLIFLDSDALQDLGIFGSLMLIGTILFVLVALPVLVSSRRGSRGVEADVPSQGFPNWKKERYRGAYAILLLLLTSVFYYFSLNTSFDSDMQHINYMTEAQRTDLSAISSGLNSSDSTTLVYAVAEGKTLDKALSHNEKLINALDTIGGIRQMSSLERYLPSVEKQSVNLRRWHEWWKKHPEWMSQIRAAWSRNGFSDEAIAPFITMSMSDEDIQDVRYFAESLPDVLSNFIIEKDDEVKIVNFLRVEKGRLNEVKSAIRQVMPTCCYVFDATDVSSHLVSLLSDSFDYIGFVCGFVVFVFLWLSFGRLELSILSFLPLAVSWIWILGIMDLSSIQFNIVNIILATFIFGQGDDYTIFITEGLIYEYAYGKTMMRHYRNSVILSAIIMFVGLGTLILAKHPAMRSLAQVAIIGMITVVLMALFLPPMVYRWMVSKNGIIREYPVTIKRVLFSVYSFAAFLLGMLGGSPFIILYTCFVRSQSRRSLFIHKVIYYFANFVIHRVPGTTYKVLQHGTESFQRPAMIICNHQSQLDLMAVLALYPKITILTKEWVWRNPFYGSLIRASEFYPVTDGLENHIENMKDMVSRGYSIVVFPEGTRSSAGINRFHKGAFVLAKQLGLDILPLYIHGFNDVLPKHDFMLREGRMTLEIGERMPADIVATTDTMTLRKHFHVLYVKHFEEMKRSYENSAYFVPLVRYRYMFKGSDVERRANRILKDKRHLAEIVDRDFYSVESYVFDEAGQGEIPLVFALVHPNIEVYADFYNEDDYLVASHLQGIPRNLHLNLVTECLSGINLNNHCQ